MIHSFKKVIGYIIDCFVVHVLGRMLKYIPELQEACNKKVRSDPRFLEFIPDNLNEAIEADPYTLNFVPVLFWTHEMFYRDFKKYLYPMRFMPDHLKTQEMCNKVEKDPYQLGDFPDHFKTQDLCKKALQLCPRLP